jgi:hypothetical protein
MFVVLMPNFEDSKGVSEAEDILSPLNLAIAVHNMAVYDFIANDIDLNVLNTKTPNLGNTSWHIAASRNGSIYEVLWKLFHEQEGFDMGITNNDNQTPLMFAARFLSVKNAEFIIDRATFAQINAFDKLNKSAKYYAINYYIPGDSSTRMLSELANRSREILALFDNVEAQTGVAGSYLDKLQPFAPELINSIREITKNASKRLSGKNVNALAEKLILNKNSTPFKSILGNTRAIKKLEKLVIALESRPAGNVNIDMLIQMIMHAHLTIFPPPNHIRFDTKNMDLIKQDLWEYLRAKNEDDFKNALMAAILRPLVPQRTNSKLQNSHKQSSYATLINDNAPTPKLPPSPAPLLLPWKNSSNTRVADLVDELDYRELLDPDLAIEARTYVRNGDTDSLKALLATVGSTKKQTTPENNPSVRDLFNRIIVNDNMRTLALLGIKKNTQRNATDDIRIDSDIDVIVEKATAALTAIDRSRIEPLIGPDATDILLSRNNSYGMLSALAKDNYKAFLTLKKYVEDAYATAFLVGMLDSVSMQSKELMTLPLTNIFSLNKDPMSWTIQETLDIFNMPSDAGTSRQIADLKTAVNEFAMRLDIIAEGINPLIAKASMRQRISEWSVILSLSFKLRQQLTNLNQNNIKKYQGYLVMTWRQFFELTKKSRWSAPTIKN